MKIINKAMLKVVEEYAMKYGYIETSHKVEDLMLSDFWGTSFSATKKYIKTNVVPTFESIRYISNLRLRAERRQVRAKD